MANNQNTSINERPRREHGSQFCLEEIIIRQLSLFFVFFISFLDSDMSRRGNFTGSFSRESFTISAEVTPVNDPPVIMGTKSKSLTVSFAPL